MTIELGYGKVVRLRRPSLVGTPIVLAGALKAFGPEVVLDQLTDLPDDAEDLAVSSIATAECTSKVPTTG